MIPQAYLQAWRTQAPWPDMRQVEQDLIISRALCDLFGSPELADRLAFRGGTAIHKLLFQKPLRYSEDIDLVQRRPEPIGTTIDAVRKALAWLGRCRVKQAGHSIHMLFTFDPEEDSAAAMKVKVEINTREQQSYQAIKTYPFVVDNGWYEGNVKIASYTPEELFGTKLRACLQRRKNRDLFDLQEGLNQLSLDTGQLIASFEHYLAQAQEGQVITRASAEQRMLGKLSRSLTEDVAPLLPAGITFNQEQAIAAFNRIWLDLIRRLPGDPWKLSDQMIQELRENRYPTLLQPG